MRPFVSLVSAAVAALAFVGLPSATAQTGQAVRIGSVHPDSTIGRFLAMRMDGDEYVMVGERGIISGRYQHDVPASPFVFPDSVRIEGAIVAPGGMESGRGITALLLNDGLNTVSIAFDNGSVWHEMWSPEELDAVREALLHRCAFAQDGYSRWQFCESLPHADGSAPTFRHHRFEGTVVGEDPISTSGAVRIVRSEDGIITTVAEGQPAVVAIGGATIIMADSITAVQPLPVDGGTLLTTASGGTFYIDRYGSEPVAASLLPAQGERIDSRPWRYLGGAAWYGPQIAITLVADVEADPSDPDADIVVLRDVLGGPDVHPVTATGQPIRFPGRVIDLGVMSRRINIPVAAENVATLYGAVVAIMADSSVYVADLGLPTSVDAETAGIMPAVDVHVQAGTVDIRVVDPLPGCSIRVMDLLGTTVADGDGGTLRVHGLASGTYVVHTVNGRHTSGKAVMVNRQRPPHQRQGRDGHAIASHTKAVVHPSMAAYINCRRRDRLWPTLSPPS